MIDKEIVVINTVKSIKEDLAKGKRTIKAIARGCGIISGQVDPEYREFFTWMSECKTRREFDSFINLVI